MLVCAQPTWVACIVRLSLSIERHCSARPQNIRAALPQAEAFARTTSDGEIPFFAMDLFWKRLPRSVRVLPAHLAFCTLATVAGRTNQLLRPPRQRSLIESLSRYQGREKKISVVTWTSFCCSHTPSMCWDLAPPPSFMLAMHPCDRTHHW